MPVPIRAPSRVRVYVYGQEPEVVSVALLLELSTWRACALRAASTVSCLRSEWIAGP